MTWKTIFRQVNVLLLVLAWKFLGCTHHIINFTRFEFLTEFSSFVVKIPQHKSITASDRSIQPYLAQQTVPFIPNLSGIPQPHIPSLVGVNIPHNPFPEITEPQIVPRKKRPRKQSSKFYNFGLQSALVYNFNVLLTSHR